MLITRTSMAGVSVDWEIRALSGLGHPRLDDLVGHVTLSGRWRKPPRRCHNMSCARSSAYRSQAPFGDPRRPGPPRSKRQRCTSRASAAPLETASYTLVALEGTTGQELHRLKEVWAASQRFLHGDPAGPGGRRVRLSTLGSCVDQVLRVQQREPNGPFQHGVFDPGRRRDPCADGAAGLVVNSNPAPRGTA